MCLGYSQATREQEGEIEMDKWDENHPSNEGSVTRIMEFGVGDVLRVILSVIVIGAVLLTVLGGAEASAESLLLLGVLGVGAFVGMSVITIALR